jgi:AAHS family 4-hydroxybenzoate transporter-like MFS transporter
VTSLVGSSRTADIAHIVGTQKFGGFQLRVVILCLCVQFLDGFDQQALAYAAPALRGAWDVSQQELGRVFGFQAFGTGIGSVLLAPLADVFGRKRIMMTAVAIFGLLTLGTVFVTDIGQLLILRSLTGFGLGAALPLTFVVANEYAPLRIRARMVASMACGFAIGAASGGLLQAEMVPYFGWQGIFYVGGVVPLLLAAALLLFLPESVRFLATREGRSGEIASILKRLDPTLDVSAETKFVLPAEPKKPGFKPAQLFTEKRAVTTILLWLTYLASLVSLNTLNNWLPVALTTAGLSGQQAVRITTLFQFGGIAGVLSLGVLADRIGYHKVLIAAFAMLAVFIAATGSVGGYAPALVATVAGMGFFLVGANNTLNAFATTLYPTDIRSTGVSWAGSFGRFVGGFGPIVGGMLLGVLPLQSVFFLFAIPAACGAFCVLGLMGRGGPRKPEATVEARA